MDDFDLDGVSIALAATTLLLSTISTLSSRQRESCCTAIFGQEIAHGRPYRSIARKMKIAKELREIKLALDSDPLYPSVVGAQQ
jgi:hypothetical protein